MVASVYGFIGFIVLACVGLIVVLVHSARPEFRILAAWVSIALVFLLGRLLKAVSVQLEPPVGFTLRPERAPQLHAEIRVLTRELSAPRVHKILLSAESFIETVQFPRLGILGFPANSLLIGWPLLHGLSAREGRALLAHEIARLSRAQSWVEAWLLRTRLMWRQVAMEAHKAGRGAVLFQTFVEFFAPDIEQVAHAIEQRRTFDADQLAAQRVGKEVYAAALTRACLTTVEYRFERLPAFLARSKESSRPWRGDIFELWRSLAKEPDPEVQAARLQQILAIEGHPENSVPTLPQRLAALGIAPTLPPPLEETAAVALLGMDYDELLAEVADAFSTSLRDDWANSYRQHGEQKARFDAFAAASRALIPGEMLEYAVLAEEFAGPERAYELSQNALRAFPEGSYAAQFAETLLAQHHAEPWAKKILEERSLDADDPLSPAPRPDAAES